MVRLVPAAMVAASACRATSRLVRGGLKGVSGGRGEKSGGCSMMRGDGTIGREDEDEDG